MLALTWAAAFLSMGVSTAETGASVLELKYCEGDFCITVDGEVKGEVGLCVVIPCSYKTEENFITQHIIWYKENRGNPKPVFSTDKTEETEAGFKGRVSLLEPDVNRANCSIMINDLTESDSGSYHLRVEHHSDGFSYTGKKTSVIIKELSQKPKMLIPPLTEGQQATLTCTAPGLCSGSRPNFTWIWSGKGEKDSHITGNTTSLNTENLTAVTQRHSSTLTFAPLAEHHNTELTCKVRFTVDTDTQETKTLTVTYVRKPRILGRTTVKEGNNLNLTCSVDSYPPSDVKFSRKLNSSVKGVLQKGNGFASYCIANVTTEDAGLYICTAKHLNNTLTEEINVAVTWFSGILNGSGCVLRSELTCVCISEGFPLPTINWSLPMNYGAPSVTNTVSDQAVSSTVTLTIISHENISVECFSSNGNGEAKEKLRVVKYLSDGSTRPVPWLEIIIAFLMGGFFLVVISFIAIKCYRKRLKKSENSVETLEVIAPDDPQFCSGQKADKANFEVQEGAVAPEFNGQSNDVTYAILDIAGLTRGLREVENQKDSETEYAEVKTKK